MSMQQVFKVELRDPFGTPIGHGEILTDPSYHLGFAGDEEIFDAQHENITRSAYGQPAPDAEHGPPFYMVLTYAGKADFVTQPMLMADAIEQARGGG